MNRTNLPIALLIAAALCAVAAAEETFVETFDDGGNEGGWWYGTNNGYTDPVGGNPDAYFRDPYVDTFAPQPRTQWTVSEFTGDYRAKGVTSVGIDLKLFYVDFSADGRPLSVELMSDNGTPGDYNDDWAAYYVGNRNIPLVGEGWLSYDFDVPSQAMDYPPGWTFVQFGPDSPDNPDWNDVITNVTRLQFFYGDPTWFYIFQVWDVGMDNPRIAWEPPSVEGDLNGDGCVNQSDLGILLGDWGCEPPSDCIGDIDGDGYAGQADLGILLANWGTGC